MSDEPKGFAALRAAFDIFEKYDNPSYPFQCSHDTLYVNIDPSLVSDEDIAKLDELGFFVSEDETYEYGFVSFLFGSC